MGLLDTYNQVNTGMGGLLGGLKPDQNRALQSLALGLLSNSGWSRTPVSFGQAFGQAGMGALQAQDDFKRGALQEQLFQGQLAEMKSRTDERNRAAQLAQNDQAQAGLIGGMMAANPNGQPFTREEIMQTVLQGPQGAIQSSALEQAMTPPKPMGASDLVEVAGPNGPMFLPASIAIGMQPYKAPKEQATPAEIQEYNLARQQGYKGTILDYQREKKGNGITIGPDGTIQIGGNGKPITEYQGKANLFGSRAEQADKIISELEGKYSPLALNAKLGAENTPVIGGIVGPIANAAISAETQKAEQAQRDFINAILRQESGAVIAQSEFDNARRQYFPQPGDSKDVIAQKKANRRLAIEGLRTMAGPAQNRPINSGGWSITRVE